MDFKSFCQIQKNNIKLTCLSLIGYDMRRQVLMHRIRADRLDRYALPECYASGEATTELQAVSLKQYANGAMYMFGLRPYLCSLELYGWARMVEVQVNGEWIHLEDLLPIGSDKWKKIYGQEEYNPEELVDENDY